MRKLVLVIPISAVAIGGATAWKLTRPPAEPVAVVRAADVRPAPRSALYDEHAEIVRLERYYGRHKLLVAFFDGRQGPDQSELLHTLRAEFPRFHEAGAITVAISALLPSQHRQGAERNAPFPFPMLSDIRDYEVHKAWGAFDETANEPVEAVFIVDRAGVIRHTHLATDDLLTPDDWINELSR